MKHVKGKLSHLCFVEYGVLIEVVPMHIEFLFLAFPTVKLVIVQ